MDWEWRRLWYSPTDRNEDFELELSKAWEPLDNSRASPSCEAKETLFGLSNGDQVAKSLDGNNKVKTEIFQYAHCGLCGKERRLGFIMRG